MIKQEITHIHCTITPICQDGGQTQLKHLFGRRRRRTSRDHRRTPNIGSNNLLLTTLICQNDNCDTRIHVPRPADEELEEVRLFASGLRVLQFRRESLLTEDADLA